jgi:hypothetical protein
MGPCVLRPGADPWQWAIEGLHWFRGTACREDQSTGYAGDGPQVMTTLRNAAIIVNHQS